MNMRRIIMVSSLALSIIFFVKGVFIIKDTLYMITKNYENRINARQKGKNYIVGTDQHDKKGTVYQPPVNIVIFGLDGDWERSDVILLANVGLSTGGINLLSIARDTRVKLNGRYVKINSLIEIGGEEMILKKIQELTGLNIAYYVTINFEGFKRIIDELDGVVMDIPFDMDYDDPEQDLHIHLKKGRQVLNGDMAEQFVRYRKGNLPGQGYIDGDIGRIRMQQELIKALIDQKLKLKYIAKADDLFIIMKKYMRTNLGLDDVRYYIKYLKDVKYDTVRSYTLPGRSEYLNNTWYYIHDQEKLNELINENFYK